MNYASSSVIVQHIRFLPSDADMALASARPAVPHEADARQYAEFQLRPAPVPLGWCVLNNDPSPNHVGASPPSPARKTCRRAPRNRWVGLTPRTPPTRQY